MRTIIIVFTIISASLFSFFNNRNYDAKTISKKIVSCDSTPVLNKQIVDFVKTKIGKKVGKGECWDVAAEALNTVGAKWDGNYKFGNEVNYKKDCVFPGDIMQFEGVTLKYAIGDKRFMEKLAHHTASAGAAQ